MRRLPCSISARTYTFVPLWIADIEKMQVESVAAIGGHLRLVADFGQATTTFIDHTDTLTA
jgi:hypothetical protein